MNRGEVVILGNGAAAVHAVRGLREAGHRGLITVLSDAADTPYSPMLLAHYLGGALSREGCFPFGAGADLHREAGVVFRGGDAVSSLDPGARVVTTRSGARYAYDRCIVATGAAPLPLPGVLTARGTAAARIHLLRTVEQADRLQAALSAGARRVLVVGASLVGMKLVEALARRGVRVVLVDVAPQVLSAAAHPDCADLVARGLSEQGVELHLGCRVEAVEASDRGLHVWLRRTVHDDRAGAHAEEVASAWAGQTPGSGGQVAGQQPVAIDVDLAVVAVGVRPNVDFVDRTQVAVGEGILVDRHCRSATPGVYAAGDCAQVWNPLSGRHEVVGLWAAACYQGRTAGRNVARELAGADPGCGWTAPAPRVWGGAASPDVRPTPPDPRAAAPDPSGAAPPAWWGATPRLESVPPALTHHVIHFLDWVFVSIGDPRAAGGREAGADPAGGRGSTAEGRGETTEVCDPDRDLYYRLVVEDGQVMGANLLNCCEGAGLLRHAATRNRVRHQVGGHPSLGWARFVQDECGVAAAAIGLVAGRPGQEGA